MGIPRHEEGPVQLLILISFIKNLHRKKSWCSDVNFGKFSYLSETVLLQKKKRCFNQETRILRSCTSCASNRSRYLSGLVQTSDLPSFPTKKSGLHSLYGFFSSKIQWSLANTWPHMPLWGSKKKKREKETNFQEWELPNALEFLGSLDHHCQG